MGTNRVASEKIRKQMAELFQPSYRLPNQPICGRQKANHYVPMAVISKSIDEIDVKDVRITTTVDDEGITHHYSVSWRNPAVRSKGSGSGSDEKPADLKSSTSEMKIRQGIKTGKIRCDGPCNSDVDIGSVVQFGCDHVICEECRKSQKSTALFDGSPGCCNYDCLKQAKTDGQVLRSGRRLDSMASSVSLRSNEGPWEVLYIHVCICKKWGNHVYRTKLHYEFPSQTRVAELTKTLQPYKDIIATGRSYYSTRKPQQNADLRSISLMDTNLRFYHLPQYKPLSCGKLFILILGDGVQIC